MRIKTLSVKYDKLASEEGKVFTLLRFGSCWHDQNATLMLR